MASTAIPRVDDTDLDRDDLMEAAEEFDIEDAETLEDQELFEEIGRRLGEIDDDAADDDRAPSGTKKTESQGGDASIDAESVREELEQMTRDEVRDELRTLGLPVSGSKSELIQRLEAARVAAAQVEEQASEAGDEATDAAEQAGEDATETGEQAGEAAEQAGEQGQDAAQQAGEDATETAEQAGEAAEQAGEQGQDAAQQAGEEASEASADASEEATPDRQAARDDDEYRVEDDEREHISPILDLELGPLALDVLGLDIHLNRIHAVLVANPAPKHALLGKLLSGVAKTTDKLGINGAVGKVTDGVEKVADMLPTPTTGDDEPDDEGDEEDEPGILGRIRDRITGAGRSAKDAAGSATDAAGNAKDAAVDAATGGGKVQAAKEAKDAFQDTLDAGSSAKDVVTGRG